MTSSKTDTTALTNALKQVYYIYKNAVGELMAKLEVVSDECERLKQQQKTEVPIGHEDGSTKCESCIHLQNMNRTLQENLNALLIEKDATIKKLEAKLQAVSKMGADQGTRSRDRKSSESQSDLSVLEHSALATGGNVKSSLNQMSTKKKESMSPGNYKEIGIRSDPSEAMNQRQVIDVVSQEEEANKSNSKLRLTRQGKRRSCYVEEEPDTKRQRMASDVLDESSPNFREKAPNQTATVYNNSIFVPETSATLQEINPHKNLEEDDCEQSSQGILVIPETMGLDYDSCLENEDDHDSHNSQCMSDSNDGSEDKEKIAKSNKAELKNRPTGNTSSNRHGLDTKHNEFGKEKKNKVEEYNVENCKDDEEFCTQVMNKAILDLTGSDEEEEDEHTLTDSIAKGRLNSHISREDKNSKSHDTADSVERPHSHNGIINKKFVSDPCDMAKNETSDKSFLSKNDDLNIAVPLISEPGENDGEGKNENNRHDDDGMKGKSSKLSAKENINDTNRNGFLKVPKSNSAENKTPNPLVMKTPATPSTISPGIFDELKIKTCETGTPKKRTRSLFGRKTCVKDLGNVESGRIFESPIKLKEPSRNSPSNKMRQTTLSQVFDCKENQGTRSKSSRGENVKAVDENIDQEEEQMAEAIRRSLEDIQNRSVPPNSLRHTSTLQQEPEFRAPLSPSRLKSPKSKSKSKRSPNKQWHNENTSPLKNQERRLDITKDNTSPLRRSPRLLQLENISPSSQSRPQSHSSQRHSVDHARKELFQASDNLPASIRDSSHDILNNNDPGNQLSLYSLTPPEQRVWKLESEKSQTSSKRSQISHGRIPSSYHNGQDKVTTEHVIRPDTMDPNGSLNPDIHLSEYLDLEPTMSERPKKNKRRMFNQTMNTLDETIPPNLITQCSQNSVQDSVISQNKHNSSLTKKTEISSEGKQGDATSVKDLSKNETQGVEGSILNFGTPSLDLETEPQNKAPCVTKRKGRLSSFKMNPRKISSSANASPGSKSENDGNKISPCGKKNSSFQSAKATGRHEDEKDEWWDDDNDSKYKDADVFTDHEGDNETIAPSPQASQPHCSIPSSSRSYKFIGKNQKHGSRTSGTSGKTSPNIPTVDVKVLRDDNDDVGQNVEFEMDDVKNEEDSECPNQDRIEDMKYNGPVQSMMDSFDRVPREGEEEFPHVQVVRKKSERNKLDGFSCKQCYEYYKNSGLSEEEMKQKMKDCSRHRDRYRPPDTPEHFWSLGFPDTAEIMERRQTKDHSESPINVDKAPRRRRRLVKKF